MKATLFILVALFVSGCGSSPPKSDCAAFESKLTTNFGQPTTVNGNTWIYGTTSCGLIYTFNDGFQSGEASEVSGTCDYGYQSVVPGPPGSCCWANSTTGFCSEKN